nr:class II aldolase/adducin family protein [Halochromatium roseum]
MQRWQGGWANAAAFGNASVRAGGRFWITPSGWINPDPWVRPSGWFSPNGRFSPNGQPGDLSQTDALIACGLEAPLPQAVGADAELSADAALYRELYRQRPEINAILRTQGPQAIALSLRLGPSPAPNQSPDSGFVSNDTSTANANRISNQGFFEPLDEQGRRLFGRVPVLAPPQLAAALNQYPLCLVAGQGVYAAAADINQAYRLSLALELSAQIALLAQDRTSLAPANNPVRNQVP